MNKIRYVLLLGILAILVVFSLSGCWNTGELIEEMSVIHLGDANKVQSNIVLYKGDLQISGESQPSLLVSDLSYNLTQWAPQITYAEENSEGFLKIIQKENKQDKGLFEPIVNNWSLVFNKNIPLDMDIIMGSGKNEMDLSNIHLISLKAVVGTGDTIINLTGNYLDNISVYLVGGIGHTTIFFTEDIGIRLLIKGVLNRINCQGFNQIGNFYFNSAFDFSERKIYVTIFSGLSKIDINLI